MIVVKQIQLQLQIDSAPFHGNQFAPMLDRQSNRIGFIDKQGKWLIPAIFEETGDLYDDNVAVKYLHHWGIINLRGEWIIRPDYEMIYSFLPEDDYTPVKRV